MNVILIILTIAIIVAVIGAIAYLLRLIYAVKELPNDEIQVEAFGLNPWTDNHSKGRYIRRIMGSERSLIQFMPYMSNEDAKKGKKPQIITVPVENSSIKSYAKGDLDDDFNYMHIYGPSTDILSNNFKESKQGKESINIINSNNIEKLESSVVKSRDKVIDKLLMKTSGFEAVEAYVEDDEQLNKQFRKKMLNEKNKEGHSFGGTNINQ